MTPDHSAGSRDRLGEAKFLHRSGKSEALLIAAIASLQLAGAVSIAYLAGFHKMRAVLGRFDWVWLLGVGLGLGVSYVGYYFAYRGLYAVEDGPMLPAREMRAIVVAGFSGFLAHTGVEVDHYSLRRAGASKREATARVWALGGMEHGILGILGCVAGIVALVAGYKAPPSDVSVPWAVIPVPGFLIAFWLAGKYRDRFQQGSGWRCYLGIFLECVHLIRTMFLHLKRYPALLGMGLFWVADGFSAWCGLACFGFKMNGAQFALGLATGALFTRRTGPLMGAGVLMVVLPLTLWYSGAGLAVAVGGILAYRVISVWVPLPLSLGARRVLRRMGGPGPSKSARRSGGSGRTGRTGRSGRSGRSGRGHAQQTATQRRAAS